MSMFELYCQAKCAFFSHSRVILGGRLTKIKITFCRILQVAGMVAYYIVTKGQHPFGGEVDQTRNLLDGNPVGLSSLTDEALKDLLSWMLSRDPKHTVGQTSAETPLSPGNRREL